MEREERDAIRILDELLYKEHPERRLEVEKEILNCLAAQIIYDLRTQNGLSQRELAKKVNTSASAICRLEDADYTGHTLNMLVRILFAFGKRLNLQVEDITPQCAITRTMALCWSANTPVFPTPATSGSNYLRMMSVG